DVDREVCVYCDVVPLERIADRGRGDDLPRLHGRIAGAVVCGQLFGQDSAPLPAVWRTDDAAFSATWIRWVRALAPTGSRPLMPIERWTLAPASGRSFRAEPVVWTHMHVPERSRHDLRALREDR